MIIGGGTIGLIMLQLAKKSGASRVILSEPVAEKRELAKKLGADITADPLSENIPQILVENCKNINVVIECLGNVHTLEDAINWAGLGATVMMFGLTGPDVQLPVQPDIIFKKELKLTSSFINPYTFERALSILETKTIEVTPMITTIIDLDHINDVFSDPALRCSGKVIVKIS